MRTRSGLLLPFLLLVVGLLVYWKGLAGGFVFDDFPNLIEDPDWRLASLDWKSLMHVLASGIASDFGRPLAVLSFAFNYYFTGMSPWSMKATGLALHLSNTVLVYFLVSALLRRVGSIPLPEAVAAVLACLWMVHPLQVSTVLYVIQRMEVGACTGVLVALLSYLHARESSLGWQGILAWCGVVVGTLLGLGFKETALLVPAYALVMEVVVLRFSDVQGRRQHWLVGAYVFGITAAIALFLFKVLPMAMDPATYAGRDFSLTERMLTQAPVLVLYLKQILLPWPESLWFYYDNFPVQSSFGAWSAVGPFLLLVVVAVVAWCLRRRWPLVALGTGWFFVAHGLTSNVYPLELVFEHRNYFALLGVLLALVQPVAWVLRPLSAEVRALMLGVLMVYVAAMGGVQVLSWAEPARLALTMATRNPESPRAGYEFGRVLLSTANNDPAAPGWSLAEAEFVHAASLPGGSPLPEQALIIMAAHSQRAPPSGTWERLERKVVRRALGPQELSALEALVECQMSGPCRSEDGRAAMAQLLPRLTQQNPSSARIRAIYANFAFNVMADPQLAMLLIREAVSLSPKDIGYRIWLIRMGLASKLLANEEAASALEALVANNSGRAYDDDIEVLRRWVAAQPQH